MTTPENDKTWLIDKGLKFEDQLLDAMNEQYRQRDAVPEHHVLKTDTPTDGRSEDQAFAELLAFMAANPEDDTEFTALTPEEFASESFSPANRDQE